MQLFSALVFTGKTDTKGQVDKLGPRLTTMTPCAYNQSRKIGISGTSAAGIG